MITRTRTKKQYEQIMVIIENHLSKATEGGGFSSLAIHEKLGLDGNFILEKV